MPNITKRLVDSLEAKQRDYIVWDNQIKGFGVKVTPKGKKSYLYKYLNQQKVQRKPAIGIHGKITCEQAREIAKEWSYLASKGEDPAVLKRRGDRSELVTMSSLCDRYLKEYARIHKKPNSVYNDEKNIDAWVRSNLGDIFAAELNKKDVQKLQHSMKVVPFQANRVLSLISKMMNLAEEWGLRPEQSNPVYGVKPFPEKSREVFLSKAEIARLIEVLDKAAEEKTESIYVVTLFKLLLFTGARLSEIKDAKWEWVDLDKQLLNLPDSKTGKKTIHLSDIACDLLRKLPRVEGNHYVIIGKVEGKPLDNARKPWLRIKKQARLAEEVRIHDLRHSFAALSIEAGVPIYHLGKLLGHKQTRTTERYAHLADDPLRAASELTAKQLQKALEV